MTPAKTITRLRGLLEKAQPRPWMWRHNWGILIDDGIEPSDETLTKIRGVFPELQPNAGLIIAAVNTLPALLDVAEAAEAVKWLNIHVNAGEPGAIQERLRAALQRLAESVTS